MHEVTLHHDTLSLAEKIIMQTQYSELASIEPDHLAAETEQIIPGNVACLFKITEFVYNREENTMAKITTILNSLHSCGASCMLLIKCVNGSCEIYIGAINKQRYDNVFFLNTIRDVLRNGIEGNMPGTEIQEIYARNDIEDTLRECIDNGFDSQCISAVSCMSGDWDTSNNIAPNGIERLFEAIGNKNFSIVILADPVPGEKIQMIRHGYEELGSQLSAFEQSSLAVQSGKSTTVSSNYSVSVSQSIGKSISYTQSHTEGSGWSRQKDNRSGKLLTMGAYLLTKNYLAMNAVSTITSNPSESESSHNDNSTGFQTGTTVNDQTGSQKGFGESFASNEGMTLTYNSKNYHIKALLERIDWYLKWLNSRENYGMFNCCAYIVSSSAGTNMMVASEYQALLQGKRELNQPATYNTWTQENHVDQVRKYLMHLSHPVFEISGSTEHSAFTPAMLLSSVELSRHLAFPQHSVVGVSVSQYEAFGREVVRKAALRSGKTIRIGCVHHMGKAIEHRPVILDLQSLTAHTFIAGTNGSGKSNAVFRIVEELMKSKVPFLVIEPAKGEYKNVFGRENNVFVYGTNEKKSELLQLNPFWFNDDVNVLEHIDKLVEVFNASWSMYAAMPAVLKAAIENAYRACGWNLEDSSYPGEINVFPTFEDVLSEFDQKMDSTAFSQEVKGNYVGALSTRMETMCNGIYGKIFGGRNLSDEELFDTNVIIDLSRVGSGETKSLIMGMLVIRLQEYRMKKEAMNLSLQHVTILEEAHHLLRRTTSAQNDEGSNILGKSVEMISNAIAEMRSFGEGFIIVDQSPGLLDMSVMRNTNTKIVLRLPESGDREMVGNTIGLKPEQIHEISRLGTGVAVIYQKDWREAVLCKVDKAEHEEQLYGWDSRNRRRESNCTLIRAILGACGVDIFLKKEEMDDACQSIRSCGLSGREKRLLLKILTQKGRTPLTVASGIIKKLCLVRIPMPLSPDEEDIKDWYALIMQNEELKIFYDSGCIQGILLSILEEACKTDPRYAAGIMELSSLINPGVNEALKSARGIAFRRITPFSFKLELPENTEELNHAVDLLSESDAADRELANLLKKHIQSHTVRKCKVIFPYSTIVWHIFKGEALWKNTQWLIEEQNVSGWDSAMRKWVRFFMNADNSTENSVLSLLLQHKGKNPQVQQFYPDWLKSLYMTV
ncbi:MAG: ATP-binding protein [Blautia sp.]|nr:ATP-binding protein [Blautia sp.]